MNADNEIEFWADQLKLGRKQFNKPFIKNTTLKSLTYKGFGHGTCDVTIGSVELKNRIMMGVKAVYDYYRSRI